MELLRWVSQKIYSMYIETESERLPKKLILVIE